MAEALVHCDGWTLSLPGSSAPALRNVSLAIAPGERVLVTGPSGGGKSTLLRAMAGMHDPSTTVSTGEFSRRATSIGFVGQEPDEQILFPTIGEEVEFVAETNATTVDTVRRRVGRALRSMGITQRRRHSTTRLSGGEKQRLAIASALAGKPEILLLDEPTASLDPNSTALVVDAIARVDADVAIVLVEHHVEVWRDRVDRLIVVADGEVVVDGPIDAMLKKHRTQLIALGVWVPGHAASSRPTAPRKNAGEVLRSTALVARRSPESPLITIGDFRLREGEVLAFVGSNGSGKSTALRALGGLIAPASGEVGYVDISTAPHRLRADELVKFVSTVLQNPAYGFGSGRVDDEAPSHERAAVGLKGLDNRHPQSLSGGERRRLGLASALSRHPKILILDEPSFGQDANAWLDLVDRLRDFLEGRGAIIMATHDSRLVDALAHHVINLDEVSR